MERNVKMDNDNTIELFEQGKILARAMDAPGLARDLNTNELSYDFSIWAQECEYAKGEGLEGLSTTLLVSGEKIPTYKGIGFLIDSDKSDVFHIAERDSGSGYGSAGFVANQADHKTLPELANAIRGKHEDIMNEVNINVKENGYVGLFANRAQSERPLAHIILAQKSYELQTGKTLPIYIYDSKTGTLENLNMTLEQKQEFIKGCVDKKVLRSSNIFYQTENDNLINGKAKSMNYFENTKAEKNALNNSISNIEISKDADTIKKMQNLMNAITKQTKQQQNNTLPIQAKLYSVK